MFDFLDLTGTFVFALSGVLTALHKRLDAFGVFIIAFVTALGGGTLRDILIGLTPVGWMINLKYVYLVMVAYGIGIVLQQHLERLRHSLFFFDTIGLGIFTIVGVERGIDIELHPIICITLGTISASFGGVIRDILCNEIPVIFRKEIYATPSILGGLLYFLLQQIDIPITFIYVFISVFIIVLRLFAVKYKWCLPIVYNKKNG